MLEELVRVFLCLSIGEILARAGAPCPGPVLGLVILYGNLLVLDRLPEALGTLSNVLLSSLGMLFVPAGVGVLNFGPLFRKELVPITTAVLGGTLLTFIITLMVATHLFTLQARRTVGDSKEPASARS